MTVLTAATLSHGLVAAESAPQPVPDEPVVATTTSQRSSLSAEPGLAVPIGDLSQGVGIGGGASIVYHRPFGSQLAFTGRLGVLFHTTESDASLWVVPILGGARYYTAPGHHGAYLAAEAGIFWARASGEVLGQTVSASDSELGVTLGAGLRLRGVDLRAGFQFYDLGEADDSMSLMGMASFQFASL